ncbi:MAG: fumarate reductase subunit D [Myxococcales bacterium]|nr:fumarate reductase subunit D [Myxococcales bacterium]
MAKLSDPEPILWSLFGAGGMVSAFLVPAHIVIFGLMFPLGYVTAEAMSYEAMLELVQNPLVKVYLMILIALPLFTFAHRTRFTLHELNMKGGDSIYAPLLYGSAVVGAALSAWVIFSV